MAVPTFVAAGSAGAGTGSVTPGMPSGATTDDLLVLVIEGEGEDSSADNPPTGGAWTLIGSVASATDGSSDRTRCSVYWAWYDAGINRVVPDAGDHTLARIHAFRGVDTTTPIHVVASGSSSTNATSHSAVSGLSSTVEDCLVVLAYTHGDDGLSPGSFADTSLTSVTEPVAEASTSSNSDGTLGIATGEKASAGSLGTFTWTTAASEERAWFIFALTPAAAIEALVGTSAASSTASGTLEAAVAMAGAVAATTATTGALAATVALSGTSVIATATSAAITIVMPLAGSAAAGSTSTGTLVAAVPLSGGVGATSHASGGLRAAVPLAGASVATTTASAALRASVALTGATAATSTATGAIGRAVPLAGTSVAASTSAGSVTRARPLSGAADATSGASARVASASDIAGASTATSTVTGTLSAAVPLEVTIAATATTIGVLGCQRRVSGAVAGMTASSGSLSALVPISGSTDAAAIVAAMLVADRSLAGSAVGLAWLGAALSTGPAPFSRLALGAIGSLGPSLLPRSLAPGGSVPRTRPRIGVVATYPAIIPADTGPRGG